MNKHKNGAYKFMPVITLTSDWNNFDYYVASLKGRLLTALPDANIVDLSHDISPFKLAQAAFILRNSYYQFPEKTIHLICVNSEPAKEKKHVAIDYDGHYFVSVDNGILGLICNNDDKINHIYEFTGETEYPSFSILHIYPEIAKAVHTKKMNNILLKRDDFEKHVPMRPVFDENVISGSIIYIDTYKNAITNITRRMFNEVGKGRSFEILVQSNHYRITRLNTTYDETSVGELLALFNSLSLLEIAIKDGNAADLLNLNLNAVVRIKFK